MSFLYKSASGREVQHASHSALSAFRFCRRKFKLNRIEGWRQKGKKASLEFGKCLEDAIMFYHANGLKPDDCAQEFKRMWLKWSEQTLIYTDQEESWANLYLVGSHMAKLYEIRLPSLPIRNPKFQLQYEKALWPGTELADLKFQGYVDMLSTAENGTRTVIDIKTAKAPLDLTPNLVAMDPQLREYAWLSGVPDVAFLWFVKCKSGGFRKGDVIALLEDSSNWKAGADLTVMKYDEEGKQVLIGTAVTIEQLDDALDQIKGKGSTEAKNAVIAANVSEGSLTWVSQDAVTKVRLQWVSGKIPKDVLPEVGERIGGDIIQLKAAKDTGLYPQDSGVRFPDQKCSWCEFNPICLKDNKRRDDNLVQITKAVEEKEEDWLEESE